MLFLKVLEIFGIIILIVLGVFIVVSLGIAIYKSIVKQIRKWYIMAERRMFAKTIIDSDSFLEMPMSARLLYYDLGMRADDDGFVNSPKKIMKIVGASNDDMNILILRKFIIPFEKGIVVIKHWKIHNYIRSDRYKPTVYVEEKAMLEINLNDGYTLKNSNGIPNGYQGDTQDRIGKSSIGQDSLGEDSINTSLLPSPEQQKKELQIQYETEFEKLWEHYPNKKGKDQAKNKYLLARKQGIPYEIIAQGLKNYINYIKSENIEEKFIKHGSTWFNQKCWNDDYKISNQTKTEKVDKQMEILKGVHNGSIKVD